MDDGLWDWLQDIDEERERIEEAEWEAAQEEVASSEDEREMQAAGMDSPCGIGYDDMPF